MLFRQAVESACMTLSENLYLLQAEQSVFPLQKEFLHTLYLDD